MASFFKVRNIGLNRYLTDEFIFIFIYILGIKDNIFILISFKKEFYIVDKLRVNILINNDIIKPKLINIYILDKLVYIRSYSVIY